MTLVNRTFLRDRNKLKVKKHYYLHSSYRGTYWRECIIIETYENSTLCKIKFFDPNIQDHHEVVIERDLLIHTTNSDF